MKLNPNEIRAAYYAVATCRRALANKAVPPSVKALAARLEIVVRTGEAASRSRQPNACGAEELEPEATMEFVGTRLAARLLGWSPRRVQRHAADLDGRMIGNQWAFPARSIKDYRDGMEETI